MKLVIFGLTVSSSWGNGHATLWRGLCNALARQGHEVTFFERDVGYYANYRDLVWPDSYTLTLYPSWAEAEAMAKSEISASDVAVVTSYCPDARSACDSGAGVASDESFLRSGYCRDPGEFPHSRRGRLHSQLRIGEF